MRNFTLLSAIAAIAFCSSAVGLRADDTAAQAAARAALMQKMDQMNAAPTQTNAPAAAAPAPAPEQPSMAPQTPPPAATPPAAPATPPPAAAAPAPAGNVSASDQQQAEARAALMQKLNEMNGQPTEVPMTAQQQAALATSGMSETNQPVAAQIQAETNMPPAVAPLAEPPVVVSPPLATPPMTNETTQYPVNPGNNVWPASKTAPIVVPPVEQPEPPMQSPGVAPATRVVQQTAPSAQTPAPPVGANPPSMAPAETQLTGPPLPISQQKQSELQALLQRYIANQITPAQYQQERAKIIAEPN